MLDNQTRMREMLNLLESVDQGKKIKKRKLDEAFDGGLSGQVGQIIGDEIVHDDDINEADSEIDVDELADEALNIAVRHIQDTLGITTGDLAAQFFTGEFEDLVKHVLVKYIKQEQSNQILDEYLDDTTIASQDKIDEYLDDTTMTR